LTLAAFIVAFTKNWLLTLVAGSILPFICIVYGITVPFLLKYEKAVEEANEKASSLAGEILGSIRTVVAFGAEAKLSAQYAGWVQEAKIRGFRLAPMLGLQFGPAFFAIYAAFSLSFWFSVHQYAKGRINSVGDVIT
jgi:ATP-binding cassette, subfamily B (MDR/TAP), member 1